MHRWNRTVIEWNMSSMGVDTTLPLVNLSGKVEEGKTQKLLSIRAISLPEQRGRVTLKMNPSMHGTYQEKGGHRILDRFNKLLEGQRLSGVTFYRGTWGKGAWPPLSFQFLLGNEESFCDATLTIVKLMLARMDVEDNSGYLLADFTLKRDTFVRFENAWVSYVRYLRIQHRLPITCVGDEENIPILQDEDLP